MNKIFPIWILAIMISSCHQKQDEKVMYDMAVFEEETSPISRQASKAPPAPFDIIEQQEVIKKKIIKDGRLGIEVKELQGAKDNVDSLVKKHEGYYSNESFNNTDWESSYNLIVRIPSTNFEKFIAEIESGDGEIMYKAIDARDVTDQFIDLES